MTGPALAGSGPAVPGVIDLSLAPQVLEPVQPSIGGLLVPAAGPPGPIGPQGPQADGLHLDGQVPAYSDLPATVADGAVWLAGNRLYRFDNGWPAELDAPELQGPEGPQGLSGARGELGPTGPQGDAGPQGPAGSIGVSVRTHGAVGDGVTDDTAAFAAALAAARAVGSVVYVPAGEYLVTALELATHDRVVGEGRWASTIRFDGAGTLAMMTGLHGVDIDDLGIWCTAQGATAFHLTGCFRCSFTGVLIRGNHTGADATFLTQAGVRLDGNTGGTSFVNCEFNNLGIGLETACIENHVVNSKFATCYVSVRGSAVSPGNAGLYVVNTEMVGGTDDATTDTHVRIDGAANSWSLVNVWMEGCKYGIDIGSATAGPSQLAVTGSKIAARTTGIRVNACRQLHLDCVEFDIDANSDPAPLEIEFTDPDMAPEGAAINCTTTLRDDFAFGDFPPYWFVVRRGQVHAGAVRLHGMADEADDVATTKGYVDWRASWPNLPDRPVTFPPATHSHPAADIDGLATHLASAVTSDGTVANVRVLTQAAYDALGAGRPADTLYVIVG